MEFREMDILLGAVDSEFRILIGEIRNRFNECTNWLDELICEIEKEAEKSTFLLPKTPSAKRRKRRAPLEIVIENESGESASVEVVDSPRRTRSTRNTSRRLNQENVEPEIRSSRRTTRKTADQKIKKLRQQSDIEILEESVKRPSDEKIDGQRPSKSRRLNEIMVPLVEKLNTTLKKKADHEECKVDESEQLRPLSLSNKLNSTFTRNEHTRMLVSKSKVSTEVSMFPLVEKLKISTNNTVGSTENNDVTTTNTKTNCSSVMPKVLLTESKPNGTSTKRPSGHAQSWSSVENDRNSVSGSNDSTKNSITMNFSSLDKEEKSFTICEKDSKNAANLTITLESKNKADATFNIPEENSPVLTNLPREIESKPCTDIDALNDQSEGNQKVEQSSEKMQSPILSKTKKVSRYGLNSTPDAKCTKPVNKKSTEVFSPYANEPVRERVAAFEKLQAVTEEQIESPEKPMVRITRTKTRAMAKAEAEAATNLESANEQDDVAGKNLYSQNLWKAARKSLAKAKKRPIRNHMQEKALAELEMSKENSMIQPTSKYNTPLAFSTNRITPLSSSNINNSNSAQRFVGFGSSTGRFPVNKQGGNIVVGIETFISKQIVKPPLNDIKEEELIRKMEKEEEARRKKEEALKEKAEERKRKREAKMEKVRQQREALQKQKQDSEMRMQKEKEEKLKLTMQEREDKLKEQVMQKKQQAQQKAAEIEERRKQEEAARLAKLKEQEEEQRRIQAAKKKEEEQLAKRLAEEKEAAALREQQAAKLYQMKEKLMKEKDLKFKVPQKPGLLDKTFEVTENSGKPKNHYVNYGIDNSDNSDDEGVPTRPIPLWARRENSFPVLKLQKYRKLYDSFITCDQTTPDLKLMFSQYNIKERKRTSSAVWQIPPH